MADPFELAREMLSSAFDTTVQNSVANAMSNIPNMDKVEFQFTDNVKLQEEGQAPNEEWDPAKQDMADMGEYDFEILPVWNDPDNDGNPNITEIYVTAVPKGSALSEISDVSDTDHAIASDLKAYGDIKGVQNYLEAHAGSIGTEVEMNTNVDYTTKATLGSP